MNGAASTARSAICAGVSCIATPVARPSSAARRWRAPLLAHRRGLLVHLLADLMAVEAVLQVVP